MDRRSGWWSYQNRQTSKVNYFCGEAEVSGMDREISIERLARWLLYACGAVLVLAGLIGLLFDFIPDLRIEEYGSFVVLAAGALLLFGASLVYVIVPQHQERRRLAKLRAHYRDRPMGELWDLNHNIVDAAQAAILGIELAATFSHECLAADITAAERREKAAAGKTSLGQVSEDIARLKRSVDELGDYVNAHG